jgi:hypothetical protein
MGDERQFADAGGRDEEAIAGVARAVDRWDFRRFQGDAAGDAKPLDAEDRCRLAKPSFY